MRTIGGDDTADEGVAHHIGLGESGDAHALHTFEDGKRLIDSNGIPNHDVGNFPRRGNPNSIAPQDYHFQMPLDPQAAVTSNIGSASRAAGIRRGLFISSCRASPRTVPATRRQSVPG